MMMMMKMKMMMMAMTMTMMAMMKTCITLVVIFTSLIFVRSRGGGHVGGHVGAGESLN